MIKLLLVIIVRFNLPICLNKHYYSLTFSITIGLALLHYIVTLHPEYMTYEPLLRLLVWELWYDTFYSLYFIYSHLDGSPTLPDISQVYRDQFLFIIECFCRCCLKLKHCKQNILSWNLWLYYQSQFHLQLNWAI